MNTIPALIARRDVQVYTLLAVAAAIGLAFAAALFFCPPKWRGPTQVLTAVLLALPQVAFILQW